jgi:hypothetical protein
VGSPDEHVDVRLVINAKRSPEYRQVRNRVTHFCPSDSWYEDELAFVVFDLTTGADDPTATAKPGKVVFVLAADSGALLVGRVVEGIGDEIRVTEIVARGVDASLATTQDGSHNS